MKKQLLSIFIAFIFCIYVLPVFANTTVISWGDCGENATWEFTDDGTLIVSGTGPMKDWFSSLYIPWYNYRPQIKSVVVTDGITHISDGAFEFLDNLTSVSIGKDVTSIGSSSFSTCNSLESIEIPEGVTSIGRYTFYGCPNLNEISVPDSITSIENCSFTMTGYFNNPENWENGALYVGKHLIHVATDVTGEFTVKPGTLCIGESIFQDELNSVYENDTITKITLPDGLKSITKNAFGSCTVLTEINIPDSVTSIGESAFASCYALEEITLGRGITTIEAGTFAWCDKLKSITLPETVTHIKESAFMDLRAFTDVYYMGSTYGWERIQIDPYNTSLDTATIHCKYNFEISDIIATPYSDPFFFTARLVTEVLPSDKAIYAATFDKNGALLDCREISAQNQQALFYLSNVHTIKAFVWDSKDNLKPLSKSIEVLLEDAWAENPQ